MSAPYCLYCEKAFHKLIPTIGSCSDCGKTYCQDHGRILLSRPPRRALAPDEDPTVGKHAREICLQCAVQHESDLLPLFAGTYAPPNENLHHDTPDAEYFACYLCLALQGKVVLTDRYCISCKKPVCEGVHGRFMPRPHKAVGGPFFCLSCSTKDAV
jgi:hypothetical protein